MSAGFKASLVVIAIAASIMFYILRAPTPLKISPAEEEAARASLKQSK